MTAIAADHLWSRAAGGPSLSPALRTLGALFGRFLEHMAAAGGPPWHISTMGAVLSQKNASDY
jgi:hypothetical protein